MEKISHNFKKPDRDLVTDLENLEDSNYSIIHTIISQIVKEQDECLMQQIEKYVKEKQAQGEIVSSQILGEGKIRHIINLGLMEYSRRNHIPITQEDLFTQEDYIQYLNTRLDKAEKMILKLQQENQHLAEVSGLLSTDTILGGENFE